MRLFTFGCSFTRNNLWPTWADLLSQHERFDHYENWGKPGAGNQYILESIIECDLKNHFTYEDFIFVMWSNHQRFDRYDEKDGWITHGNVFNSPETKWITKNWSIKGGIMHSFNAIHIASHFLNGRVVSWRMGSLCDLSIIHEDDYGNNVTIFDEYPELKIYEDVIASIDNWVNPTLHEYCLDTFSPTDWKTLVDGDKMYVETHPTPEMNWRWLHDLQTHKWFVPSRSASMQPKHNVDENIMFWNKLLESTADPKILQQQYLKQYGYSLPDRI